MSSSLLIEAIAGRLDGESVTILAIDEEGAVVEHSIAKLTSPPEHRLQFAWEGEELDLKCSVAPESEFQEMLSDSRQELTWHVKVAFSADADLTALVRARESWRRKLDSRQEENLMGASVSASAAMLSVGQAFREHKQGYIAFVFRGGKWTSRESRSPEQPWEGFTVAAFETDQQIELLKLAYEEADREGRDLIRRFAAASLVTEK